MIWPEVHHEMYLLVQHQVQLGELFRAHLGINESPAGAIQVQHKWNLKCTLKSNLKWTFLCALM